MFKASLLVFGLLFLSSCAVDQNLGIPSKNVDAAVADLETVRSIQADGDSIDLKIGNGEAFVWRIRPEKDVDPVQIYCPAQGSITVQFASESAIEDFQVSGLDYIEFVIVDGSGRPARTAIECFPEPINYKGDYAVTSEGNRNYYQDLNSGTLDAHIRELMDNRAVPGLSVAVVQGNDILFQASYGLAEIESQTPFTNETQSRIASATKFLAMLAIVSLAEDGVIDINNNLGTYLPEVRADWANIPVWQIMNHTSGVPEILSNENFLALSDEERAALSYRDVFDIIRDKPLDFVPGAEFRYQQSAYTLLVMILTEATGKTWDELIKEHVFVPAGMTETSYGDWLTEHPRSYNLAKGKLISPPYFYPPTLSSGAGYNATSNDLTRLMVALNEGKIVNPDYLKAIAFNREYLLGIEGYGAGTVVKVFGDVATMGHSGGGDMADIRYVPDLGIGIFVISNREGSDIATSITTEISELLFGE